MDFLFFFVDDFQTAAFDELDALLVSAGLSPSACYLRAGGRLIGEPHHDVAFNCADVPMLLALDRLEARYSRRFLRSA